jgi:two-component system sensor histidine kinase ChvG
MAEHKPGPRLIRSLRLQGFALLAILMVLPVLLASIFLNAQGNQKELLVTAVRDAGSAIAAGLAPELKRQQPDNFDELDATLARFADPRRSIVLLFHPKAGDANTDFFFVASAPVVPAAELDRERERLAALGVLPGLAQSCTGGAPLTERVVPAGYGAPVITSITGVESDAGCWAIVIAVSAEGVLAGIDDRPFWMHREVQLASIVYFAMAALILLIFEGVRANLRRFRRVALAPDATAGFLDATDVPEMAPVASAIDSMVNRLRSTADMLRQAAEDNAHALKGPIANIRHATEPLIAAAPTSEQLHTALNAVKVSLDRLDGLVRSARRLDTATADLLEISEGRVDLSELLRQLLADCRAMHAAQEVRIIEVLARRVVVRGEPDAIETIFENLLDNALGFSPTGGTIRVSLVVRGSDALVSVEDDGPGVPDAALANIFDRYYSDRRAAPHRGGPDPAHYGVGLSIVRQNTRALGGDVVASNRVPRGLCLQVRLPLAERED